MTRDQYLLRATTVLMAVCAVAAGAGLIVDPRVIDNAPAWLKPLKFAVSTAIYSATFAWMSRYLTAWPRVRQVAAWTTAVVFLIEVGLIAMQAARGTSSHFNASTRFDGTVFTIMGTAIFLQTIAAAAFTFALWKQPFKDAALGRALRLGMAITVVGGLTGGLMSRPTADQLASVPPGQIPLRAGAHTVGGPDGGPGLPGTGWSIEHGDLRVAHFTGLHAMQALPVVLLVAGRRRPEHLRQRLVTGSAALYASLFVLLLAQALAGQPLIAPQGLVRAALVTWLVSAASFSFGYWRASRTRLPAWKLA